MATQAPNNLPLLYQDLEPLSRQAHGDKKARRIATTPGVNHAHAVPVTVDEFMLAGAFFPDHFLVRRSARSPRADGGCTKAPTLFSTPRAS